MSIKNNNLVVLEGRLVRDPEKKTTQSGKDLTNFSIAVSNSRKNEDGTYGAFFFDCFTWGENAVKVSQFAKGATVELQGKLIHETWEKDGKKGSRVRVQADSILCYAPKPDKPKEEKKNDDMEGFVPIDTDLPF